MTTAAISIEGLVKVYSGPPAVRAVDGIDLEVHEGETFGLLGPNGAGKTTTVGVCTTRVRATEGRAVVAGVDVAADSTRAKARMGVVTQFNTLDRSLSVRQNLYYHCRYFGMSRREARRRADELLERFRLEDRAIGMTIALSGGMAQRLQVARAVAHRPRVLFLDEPTAGLDPQSRIALWEVVEELKAEGVTVLLTTHYMEEADSLCDRVAIVDHGKVLVLGPPSELRRSLGTRPAASAWCPGSRHCPASCGSSPPPRDCGCWPRAVPGSCRRWSRPGWATACRTCRWPSPHSRPSSSVSPERSCAIDGGHDV